MAERFALPLFLVHRAREMLGLRGDGGDPEQDSVTKLLATVPLPKKGGSE
ncbi:MAG: hypothetical protein ACQEXJ_18955 [Myxococcota bacterium]